MGHDRDYSNVDVHEHAMLPTMSEGRLIADKHGKSKKKTKKCFTLIYKT